MASRAVIARILKARAVLLDLDNTLYPYLPHHRQGLRGAHRLFCSRVRRVSLAIFQKNYEAARREVKRHTAAQAASHSRLLYFQEMLRRESGRPQPRLTQALEGAYWTAYMRGMKLRPWVMPLLKQLRERGIRVAIVTNMTLDWQLKKISRLGLAPWIDALVSSEEAGVEKPDPKIFRLALKKLGCSARNAVGLGDDPVSDRSSLVKFYRI